MNKTKENFFGTADLQKENFSDRNYFLVKWNQNEFRCSKKFENLIGFTADEINNLPFKHHSMINDNGADLLHNSIINHFENSTNDFINDIEISTKFGKSIWFREYICRDDSDNISYFRSMLFNITEFKKIEIELNEEISSKTKLNSSKDKLISIISHDLRAPFSSLLGFAEILLNEQSLPESERDEYLQYIYDASKIQLEMVNHLLDWTRLQTGTVKFNPQKLEIKDIIDNSVSVLTGSSIRKDVDIKVDANSNLSVNADERLINQVVTNLLSNAVKFTPPGRSITISTDLYKENMVEVIVADEGVGIDEEHHHKLFRIDAKFTKVGTQGEKGSGYGLALVKEIIEKHGGEIWFYSEKNKGSEFHFTLPKSEDMILVVEEHEDLRTPYKRLVGDNFSNYSLTFLNNGIEAHSFILDNIPSVIITYHEMPLMNGIQLITGLRKKDLYNRVLVIILADNLSEREVKNYSEMGVKYILPINSKIDDIKNILFEDLQ